MSAGGAHSNGTDTIVLIHGLWLTGLSWERWIGRYRARGYRVLAPNWPGMDAGIEELRQNPATIAHLGVTEIAAHYDHLIRDLSQPPVIIGHCVGGLVAQILLDRGLGAAGVAIDPAPANGVRKPSFSMLRAGFPALLISGDGKTIPLTHRRFHAALTNTLSKREAVTLHERHYIPGPARAIRQVSFASFAPDQPTRVAFESQCRAPLLLIASGKTASSRLRPPRPASSGTASRRPSPHTRSSGSGPITQSVSQAGSTSPTTPSGGRSNRRSP
jgi:pimeloyl-ACP methyl ester carboxylesterase